MSRVLKKPAAVRDLIANGRHIAKDSLSAAERFLDAAERYFRRVGATSRDRASAPFPTPPRLRSWHNYLIFYNGPMKRVFKDDSATFDVFSRPFSVWSGGYSCVATEHWDCRARVRLLCCFLTPTNVK